MISQSARVIADANLRHSSPSWQVQPALCTYQNLIKTSGCTCQDGVNWRQQVKIFADKNIKGSDRSETSGTISYSVPRGSKFSISLASILNDENMRFRPANFKRLLYSLLAPFCSKWHEKLSTAETLLFITLQKLRSYTL